MAICIIRGKTRHRFNMVLLVSPRHAAPDSNTQYHQRDEATHNAGRDDGEGVDALGLVASETMDQEGGGGFA